jgi:hypothetical protein
MEGQLEKGFYFSQHSLDIFRTCPIRFKKKYIDGLYWSSGNNRWDQRMQKGRYFHLMAERHFSGIPLRMEFFEEYGELNEWIDALKRLKPEDGKSTYYPEYQIKIRDGDMLLQAKYDLVVADTNNSITIYDWKTEPYPLKKQHMKNRLQTRVYPYVMVKGGERLIGREVKPEDVVMVYWQPTHPDVRLTFSYSQAQFEEDQAFLRDTIQKILNFDYHKYQEIQSKEYCPSCEYNFLCNGQQVKHNEIFMEQDIELADWDDIPEFVF